MQKLLLKDYDKIKKYLDDANYEGYNSREIAKLLNKNESTIRTYLKKGRELLKDNLGGLNEK